MFSVKGKLGEGRGRVPLLMPSVSLGFANGSELFAE